MKSNSIILLIICSFLLANCNKLLYEVPMPIGSEHIHDLPESFVGEYLVVNHTEQSVDVQFRYISEISDKRYLIEVTNAVILDSLTWRTQKMAPIKSINVHNRYLEIVTSSDTHKRRYKDTISRSKSNKELEFDFNEGVFYEAFASNQSYEDSKRQFQLLMDNGKYFLNTADIQNNWLVTKIEVLNQNLNISTLYFHLENDDDKLAFQKLFTKYNLKKIKLDRPGNDNYHLANSDNNEMAKIIDEEFFSSGIWYRINNKSTSWFAVIIVLLSLLYLIFIAKTFFKNE